MSVDLDWHLLYFGKMCREEVSIAIRDSEWQKARVGMKGKTTTEKYKNLCLWLSQNNYSRKAQIQVTNYVTALARGGIIKPEAYKNIKEKL